MSDDKKPKISKIKPDCEIFPFAPKGFTPKVDKYIKLKGINLPKMKTPSGYEVSDDGIFKVIYKNGKAANRIRISKRPVLITGTVIDVNTRNESVLLEWLNRGKNKWEKEVILFEETQIPSRCLALSKKGISVAADTTRDLSKFLYKCLDDNNLPVASKTSSLGWIGKGDDLAFLHGKNLITSDEMRSATDISPSNWSETTVLLDVDTADGNSQTISSYNTVGELSEWKRLYNQLLDKPTALIGLYLSMVTPALKLFPELDNPIVDFHGKTASGKTTILKLIASVYGDPNSGGIIKSWNSSEAGRERHWSVNNYLPSIFDDSMKITDKSQLTQAVYDFSGGVGKLRGTVTGSQRVANYKGILFSTGEYSITSYDQAAGACIRVLGLQGSPLGPVDQNTLAKDINSTLSRNYGHIGPMIMQYLISNQDKWSEIRSTYRATDRKYQDIAESDVAKRAASIVPLIELGMHLAKQIGLPSPKCDVLSFAFDAANVAAISTDLPKAALEEVFSRCVSQAHRFWGRHSGADNGGDGFGLDKTCTTNFIGSWNCDTDWEIIGINGNVLRDWLNRSGYDKSIINRWNDRGWLKSDKNKNTTKMIMGESRPRLICIRRSAFDEANED